MDTQEVTVEKFAEMAFYKEQTVREKISKGKLPVKKYGHNVRILLTDEVLKLVENRKALFSATA